MPYFLDRTKNESPHKVHDVCIQSIKKNGYIELLKMKTNSKIQHFIKCSINGLNEPAHHYQTMMTDMQSLPRVHFDINIY